jgi:hypothetical protein
MSVGVGDEQIYRLRDYVPSDRVRIVAIDARKKTHATKQSFSTA